MKGRVVRFVMYMYNYVTEPTITSRWCTLSTNVCTFICAVLDKYIHDSSLDILGHVFGISVWGGREEERGEERGREGVGGEGRGGRGGEEKCHSYM